MPQLDVLPAPTTGPGSTMVRPAELGSWGGVGGWGGRGEAERGSREAELAKGGEQWAGPWVHQPGEEVETGSGTWAGC